MENALYDIDNRDWVFENLDALIQAGSGKSVAKIYIDDSDIFHALSKQCSELMDDDDIAEVVCFSKSGCIQYMSPRIRNNVYYMSKAIETDPSNAQYIGETLANDIAFMRKIVKDSHRAIIYASEEIRDDPAFFYEYVETATDKFGRVPYLNYFSERLRSDPYMVNRIMEQNSSNYTDLPESVKMDDSYAYAFLKDGGHIRVVPAEVFEKNLDLACMRVRMGYSEYGLLPEAVKDNILVALNAMDTYVPHTYSWYIPGGWGDEYICSSVFDMTENVMNNIDFQKYLIVAYCKTSFFKLEDYDVLHENPKAIFDILQNVAKTYWVYDTDDMDKVEKLDLSEAIAIEQKKQLSITTK